MCTVLSEHGVTISASTYYEWVSRAPTKQQVRDEHVTELIAQLRVTNTHERHTREPQGVDQAPFCRS
jgi:hypothetical protein